MNCLACGHANAAESRFCNQCGGRLDQGILRPEAATSRSYTPKYLADKIFQSRSAMEGERKQVTVLFCDIVGSTPLAARLGADRMHSVLNEFFGVAMAEVHRFEGTVNQFLGDGFMALFGAPIAHEDHARRAALAALAVRDAVAGRAWATLPQGETLQIRIGLNMGGVVFGKIGDDLRMDFTAIGDTTNVASRLQGEAPPGGVVCSEAVAHAVEAYVECNPIGMRVLKGKVEPMPVHEVLATRKRSHHAAGVLTTLFGREVEIAHLRTAIDSVRAGIGGVLAITGQAGLGKTRLLGEARRHSLDLDVRWVEGGSLSFGSTFSYWPFREVVRQCFAIVEDDGEHRSWSKLHTRMTALFGQEIGGELSPYIGVLLALGIPEPFGDRIRALDGLSIGHQIFRSALKLFARLSRESPLIVAFEDWHWADSSSAALLEHLMPLSSTAPILFVIAGRPEQEGAMARFRASITGEKQSTSGYRELALAPLAVDDAARMIGDLLGDGALPSSVRKLLLRRAAGSPFYLSELIRTLQATGAIERDKTTGHWTVARQFTTLPLPDSIEGVILARIDRLEEDAKQVLKVASVVGRSFIYRVLKAVADGGTALDSDLARLTKSEFIDQKLQAPELEYMFKHPLIQQASYNSLLQERRRQLHQKVGEIIEKFFDGRIEEFYPVLAYHFAQAEHWPKAQEYLLKAGDHAGALSADAEALELYHQALATSEKSLAVMMNGLERAELDCKIGEALYRSGHNEQALQYLRRALDSLGVAFPKTNSAVRRTTLAEFGKCLPALIWRLNQRPAITGALLDPESKLRVRIFEAMGLIDFFSEPQRMFLDILLAFKSVSAVPDSREYVVALAGLGVAFTMLGIPALARRCNLRATHLGEEIGDQGALGHCYSFRAIEQVHQGKSADALANYQKAISCYLSAGNLRQWSMTMAQMIIVLRYRGDPSWIAANTELLRISSESNDQQGIAWAWKGLGWQCLMAGDVSAAAREFDKARIISEQIPDYRKLAICLSELGRCRAYEGDIGNALQLAKEGASLVIKYGIRGISATPPLMAAAEVLLLAAERVAGSRRTELLRDASDACKLAAVQGRRMRDYGAAESIRLEGLLAFLTGDREKSERRWRQSIRVAESLETKPVLAQAHFDIGRRLGQPAHLLAAKGLFVQIGASRQAEAIEELLASGKVPRVITGR